MTSPSHLQLLEAEAIHIFREVAAEAQRPVLLYSAGKDSAVLLHLALKAFHPAALPFPLLHVASGWDFAEVIAHRDAVVARHDLTLIIASADADTRAGLSPFTAPPDVHAEQLLTAPLKAALDAHGFDAAFGGGRRDEERARAKERIVSVRAPGHRWDPQRQRPELWALYNLALADGESLRVFPLSNWTERDVWDYIASEGIAIAPLYFAAPRPTIRRAGQTIIVADASQLPAGTEAPVLRRVRCRTLGCWPLTGVIESQASDLAGILAELDTALPSERHGRLIDREGAASMEQKKQAGYF